VQGKGRNKVCNINYPVWLAQHDSGNWLHSIIMPLGRLQQQIQACQASHAHPVLHELKTPTELTQEAAALANVTAVPQVPQFLTSFVRLTSQPLAGLLSQLPKLQQQKQKSSIASYYQGKYKPRAGTSMQH
jgi:hypothetical protein